MGGEQKFTSLCVGFDSDNMTAHAGTWLSHEPRPPSSEPSSPPVCCRPAPTQRRSFLRSTTPFPIWTCRHHLNHLEAFLVNRISQIWLNCMKFVYFLIHRQWLTRWNSSCACIWWGIECTIIHGEEGVTGILLGFNLYDHKIMVYGRDVNLDIAKVKDASLWYSIETNWYQRQRFIPPFSGFVDDFFNSSVTIISTILPPGWAWVEDAPPWLPLSLSSSPPSCGMFAISFLLLLEKLIIVRLFSMAKPCKLLAACMCR